LDKEGLTPIIDILGQLEISIEMVKMEIVNYRAVSREFIVSPGDGLSLFPKEYSLFAQWKGFRF